MYEELFSDRLSSLRNLKGVSAREMSLSLGQNPGYINNIESGKALPSMSGFFYICEYLDVSPQEFFDLSSSNPVLINEILSNLKKLDSNLLNSFANIIHTLANK